MKTPKIIFDTVHFMITLMLITAVVVLYIKLESANETIETLGYLYNNVRDVLSSLFSGR